MLGPKDICKFITLLPKDYYLIPGNGAINLLGPKDICKFITLLPKDYYLIPGNGAINLFGLDQDDMYTNLKRYHQRIII